MNIVAVANQKGGVGKTTTTVSLGGLLAQAGERVLLLDLDPHGSLTSYFGFNPEGEGAGVYTLFQRRAQGEALNPGGVASLTGVDGLSLICASTAMATLDRQLGAREGMGLVVAESLAQLRAQYSWVLMDCPPMLGVLMVNALAACQHLLVPVQTEFLALKGLERMLRTVSMVQRSRTRALDVTLIPTLFDRRTRASIDTLRQLREDHTGMVWPGVIPVDTQFREASRAGQPLTTMRPSARGSKAYAQLLEWLLAETPLGGAIPLREVSRG
ncbi:cobalamin biosynthesis protein CobQ [Acidihalobacter aeolianus]|uniref:Cobalamin biosynthesis protein CobQ n=1 Tax=Acidihalobacter aeolianus TaxID=2792603 RepID=A0A1D8K6Q5_9GAMM|nr:ParA family protein [Acidihalobacter aeolianus]AOV16649.1 cobalamin biosynthesis protein CobQ [Acidihalobacter aeolianus]